MHMPIFELYLSCIYGNACSRNRTKTHNCYNEIGLCAQNKNTILSAAVNTIEKVNLIALKIKRNLDFDPLLTFASELQF